ncbi:hypothetical protein OG279_37325 (plasmid) [Streptomyces sp. NBC_01201]|uniref:hypothetical protein n=1 Tax=Streptomyces sp. NBC_01201 TaxID=2903770 RepID=UPI002E0F37C7|nr:hypothetical protein OG279_37325 [Streptomyces sp. NBC_01201]
MSAAVEYHYVLTLSGTTGPRRDQVMVGTNGVVELDPATSTRAGVCNELIKHVQDAVLARTGSLLDDPNIVCVELEPNQL